MSDNYNMIIELLSKLEYKLTKIEEHTGDFFRQNIVTEAKADAANRRLDEAKEDIDKRFIIYSNSYEEIDRHITSLSERINKLEINNDILKGERKGFSSLSNILYLIFVAIIPILLYFLNNH